MTGRRLTSEEREKYWHDGYAIVPIDAADTIGEARDAGGELIFTGGTEHYFRNAEEARWYGRQVWRGFLRAMDSLPPSGLAGEDEEIHGRWQAGG